ncbi:hypothetical protein [Scytonema sp. PCC 10023]|uniref:hypothetical protein n=1 Tax=Scytonema sp. PCC 10023 TaxID=1680591 RepID=UPI0039C5B67F
MKLSTIDKVEVAKKIRLHIKIAKTHSEVLQCQSLIAEIYYKKLGIMFSDSIFDPEAKIELYPQQCLMGLVDGELIASIGLYTRGTNAERHGKVTEQDIEKLLVKAGAVKRYSGKYLRELTKFVVRDECRNQGIGKVLLGAAHSKDFIHLDEAQPHVLVACATLSIFKYFSNSLGIHTRSIKPIPLYKVHEYYRSDDNPMESRLIIPDIDIPEQLYNTKLPKEYEIEKSGYF